MKIWLETMGRIRLTAEDRDLSSLIKQKTPFAVFVYLAVRSDVDREEVVGVFWRERSPERARHSLSQALYALRNVLGDEWLETSGPRLRVTDDVVVDVADFEQAAASGEIDSALRWYGGPFLSTFSTNLAEFERWVERKRITLDRLHRGLRKAAVSRCLGTDDLAAALSHARLWVSVDVLDDEAQHEYIELLAASGDRANAIRQYDMYRAALAQDGLRPLDQTDELIARIRSGDSIGGSIGASVRPGVAGHDSESNDFGDVATRRATRLMGSPGTVGPRLVRLIDGGREGEAYPLVGPLQIGRFEGDLRFPEDHRMSSLHASVRSERSADGGVADATPFVMEAGGGTGVFMRVRGDRPLREGDSIAAGQQVFRFEAGLEGSTAS